MKAACRVPTGWMCKRRYCTEEEDDRANGDHGQEASGANAEDV